MQLSTNSVFIFDFDDTLFDTHELRKRIFENAEGVVPGGKERFHQEYEAARGKSRDGQTVDKNFIDLLWLSEKLAFKSSFTREELYKQLFLDHPFHDLLLPGSKVLLNILKDKEIPCFLVTQGDSYQHSKIEKTEISPFFKKVFLTDRKSQTLTDIINKLFDDDHDVCVIDDKPEILQLAKSLGAKTIWIRHGKYAELVNTLPDYVDFACANPNEVLQLLDF
jgi:FMN phosphatase YigB (HAD superfamily)